MNSVPIIRSLYTPIQPTMRQTKDDVTYHEFLPSPTLQPFIYCYWQLKTTAVLTEPFVYRVVADGCIDIFFELDKPDESFVMGFCKQYTEFPLPSSFNYVGIRFLPTMFPQFFNVPASELSNRFEKLNAVLPETALFIAAHFHPQLSPQQMATLLDNYFLALLPALSINVDKRLYQAIEIIFKNYGVLDVQSDLDTGISPRQLRRLFDYYIGDSAKTFSQVVRFQNILRAKPSRQSLRENKLFFDAGYYDQAHFIKEFKIFMGLRPRRLLGEMKSISAQRD